MEKEKKNINAYRAISLTHQIFQFTIAGSLNTINIILIKIKHKKVII